ncbi:MAG TPA: DUF4340 domain-containing protein [Gammaproteobacteria bacterium]|nr:DUF4340 domain-containing protein [Gammaproteobacteria bacterium]
MSLSARSKLNLVLALLVVGLAALVYFKPGSKPSTVEQAPALFPAASVTDIRIARGNGPAYELKRAKDGWQLVAPLALRADDYLLQDLLSEIGSAHSARRYPVAGADLGKYGLDKPVLRLWVNGVEADFGGTEPLENNHYVKDGGNVDLVGGLLFYRLDHEVYWWADKHLLPAGSHITGLELPHATLMQDKGGKWQLYPAEPKVTADMLQRLVDDWQAAQAVSVAALGKGKPDGEVALSLAGQAEPLRFQILNDENFFVLARPDLGLQYELDGQTRYTLIKPIVVSAAPAVTRAAPTPTHHRTPAPRKKARVVPAAPATLAAPPAVSAPPASTAGP